VVGYQTPNIDRLAKKGALFTNYYGHQSYTAGQVALSKTLPRSDFASCSKLIPPERFR
jgi:hypothetical protein